MQTENPVVQLLVTSGNQALLAAGSRPDALANGQLGIFNYHTGLSIDGTVPADAQDIFMAVGINRTSGGTNPAEDIQRSAGQNIQPRHAKSYTFRGYQIATQQVFDVTDMVAYCDTDYNLKIELRGQAVYNLYGYNALNKVFNFYTGACSPTTNCDDCKVLSNEVDLAQGLMDAINADPDALMTASLVSYKIGATVTAGSGATAAITVTVGTTVYSVSTASGDTAAQVATKIAAQINTQASSPYRASVLGAVLTIYPTTTTAADTDTIALTTANGTGVTFGSITAATKTAVSNSATYKTTYPGATVALRVTSNAEVRPQFGTINVQYHKSGLLMIPSFDGVGFGGDTGNGTITNITNLQFGEGSGYDLKQIEYEAGGWNGKPGPYRTVSVTGLPSQKFEYFISEAGTYSVFSLEYDIESISGTTRYKSNVNTLLVVPCADATTMSGAATVLDLIFTMFGAMANDVTQNGDCTNVATSTLTAATDGIESRA